MSEFTIFALKKTRQKYNLLYNRNEVARLQPKIGNANTMKFKEQHKTALAKVLSDLLQCDGIVNQGEIDFLQQVYGMLNITSTSRKKATNLSLSEAVSILKSLGNQEKIAILRIFQRLSLSDDSLDPNESMLITALLLSIGIELPETEGINANFVSIPNLNFDTHNAVLYVEPAFDKAVNASINREYEAICALLQRSQREFFYLPKVILDLESKKTTFRNTVSYIEPLLSDEQLDLIDSKLSQLDSVRLSKEVFLNYLNANGLKISKPSFFLKIGNMKPDLHQDFLIIEIVDSPLSTLERFICLNSNILSINPPVSNAKEEKFILQLALKPDKQQKNELRYTGFHKIILDILLKYNGLHEYSRLFINRHGDIFLTDRNNTEVKMPALCKALYIFFLLHEDGMSLNYLNDHKPELYKIYRRISTYGDEELLNKAIDNLTDFIGSTMNANLSRIRKAFRDILGDEANIYLIKGEKGGRKIIHLDRSLVVFEDRKAFE